MAEKNILQKELADRLFNIISIAKDSGKIRKGVNEATKSVESGKSVLLVIAGNIDPEEIVMHFPSLCEEKGASFVYVERKEDLGKVAGLGVSCAAISIENPGGAKDSLNGFFADIGVKKEAKKEEKKEAKKEEKKEERKEEKRERRRKK